MSIKQVTSWLIFAVVLSTTAAVGAPQRNVVYNEEHDIYKQVTDNHIESEAECITLAWDVDQGFMPPYSLTLTHDGKVVREETTAIASAIVNISKWSPSKLTITSQTGQKIEITLAHRFPWSMVMWGVLATVAVCGVTYIIVYRRLFYKARKAAEATLRSANKKQTKRFECATVLFADIQGFTQIAEHTDPELLVDELDKYFIYFDELVDKYDIEKIKTIGDAYMCAGGVPTPDSANPIEVTLVGLEMIAFVKEQKATAKGFWNIRVGLNTGPVVSALIGHTKKSFDIWGDTVNTASRMESSGVAGEVNVSGDTYRMISEYFECEHRGKMPVKYKGEVDMYFVRRLKPEYSEGTSGITPNALLKQKMQLMKVHDMQNIVRADLVMPAHDNVRVRFDGFVNRLEELARAEQLTNEEMATCLLAGLIHFTRETFPKDYKLAIDISNEALAKRHFGETQIENINKMVHRLSQNRKPETLTEEIIHDAYYHYYGRPELTAYLLDWCRERNETNKKTNKKEWLREHKKLIQQFSFMSNAGKDAIEVGIREQTRRLDEAIKNA